MREITATEFSKICGFKSAHNIYIQVKQNKLTKSESGKYNIFEPLNQEFLKRHGKSRIDVESYLDQIKKKTSSHCRPTIQKQEPDQSMLLLESVDIVISREYSTDEAGKIKTMIFEEMGKHV